MSEKIRFISNEPFGKYEFARFVCGIFDATEEEAKILRKSVYYGHRFRELNQSEKEKETIPNETMAKKKKVTKEKST